MSTNDATESQQIVEIHLKKVILFHKFDQTLYRWSLGLFLRFPVPCFLERIDPTSLTWSQEYSQRATVLILKAKNINHSLRNFIQLKLNI